MKQIDETHSWALVQLIFCRCSCRYDDYDTDDDYDEDDDDVDDKMTMLPVDRAYNRVGSR